MDKIEKKLKSKMVETTKKNLDLLSSNKQRKKNIIEESNEI